MLESSCLMDTLKKGKVAVALSGGVDSAMAAFLILQEGYEASGVFMHLNQNDGQAMEAAKRIADRLAMDFHIIDLKKEFENEVIDYFITSYASGLTPNPCVKCNKKLKFGALLEHIDSVGADFLATGHYIRKKSEKKDGCLSFKIFKGVDQKKDQSYFLYTLDQTQLKRLLFPLGEYTKDQIRLMAEINNIQALDKESQDICFLSGKGEKPDHNIFLRSHLKLDSGKIMDYEGRIIGTHKGFPFYTIGQRRGIGIGGTGPYYASEFDKKSNVLFVVNRFDDPRLYRDSLISRDVHWIAGIHPQTPLKCSAVIRYRHRAVECVVENGEAESLIVTFKEPQRAVTPGQSIAFYLDEELLGGGTIHS